MEWFESAAWAVGLLGGLAGLWGAWRAWRTERKVRLIAERWEARHFQNAAWIVTNRRAWTAVDVKIDLPKGSSLTKVEGDLAKVQPGDEIKIVVSRSSRSASEIATVTWRGHLKRWRQSQRVILPPGVP